MAFKSKRPAAKGYSADDFINSPSLLDNKSHAEVCMLYKESTETLRFVKNLQWKTVGATLLTFLGLIFIAIFVKADAGLTNKFMAITLLLTTSVIFTLVIYQFWMHNEMAKIDRIETQLSDIFKNIRSLKSSREANVHRYTLLVFMSVVVSLGALVVYLSLSHLTT